MSGTFVKVIIAATTTFKLIDTGVTGSTASDSNTVVTDTTPFKPIITGTHPTTTINEASVNPFSGVAITDDNVGAMETVSIDQQLGVGGTLKDGVGFTGLTPVLAPPNTNFSDGTYYNLTGSAAAVTAELDALVFTPATAAPGTTTTLFRLADLSSTQAGTIVDHQTVVTNIDTPPPVATDDLAKAIQGTTLFVGATQGVLANDTDPGGLPLAVTSIGPHSGTYGTLNLAADGSYFYDSNGTVLPADGVGKDVFVYTASDGHSAATASLTVTEVSPGTNYLAGTPGSTAMAVNTSTTLDGSLGNETLIGGTKNDFLIAGQGDVLTGGKGADTFVFTPNFGAATITDFSAAQDHLQIDKSLVPSLAALTEPNQTFIQQNGSNVLLNDGHGDLITLQNTTVSSLLKPGVFQFV